MHCFVGRTGTYIQVLKLRHIELEPGDNRFLTGDERYIPKHLQFDQLRALGNTRPINIVKMDFLYSTAYLPALEP